MTLFELISTSQTLSNIIDQKLPFKLSYKFSNLISIVEKNQEFYNNGLRKLFNEYAQKDEDGNIKQVEENIMLQPDKIGQFNKEFEELQSIEVVDEIPQFTLEELETIELTPRDIMLLKPIIKE